MILMENKPEHHIRYARAWVLHRDEGMTGECKKILEKEMDSAQNCFSWDEFQEFKNTLPGYIEYWKEMKHSFFKFVSK